MAQFDDDDFRNQFRFKKQDIHRLYTQFGIEEVITSTGGKCCGKVALMMVLYKLKFPTRLIDIGERFGRSRSACSGIMSTYTSMLSDKYRRKLNWDRHHIRTHMQAYAEAIALKSGGLLDRCIGFVDSTYRFICRPTRDQRACYNRYKRKHGVKFETISGPDGIMYHVFGGVEGRRHDASVYRESGLRNLLLRDCRDMHIVGDTAYPVSAALLKPCKATAARALNDGETEFNRQLSSLRVVVEWSYQLVNSLFAYQNYYPFMKVFGTKPAQQYYVCCLLTNCHACLYGNRISNYYNLAPPTLEEYLSY
ncbi:unnamed protein product [Heterosigma akashiwo]